MLEICKTPTGWPIQDGIRLYGKELGVSGHASNIRAFVAAAGASTDDMVKAYCGMVAIELVLKEATGLKDHNVPAALNLFAHKFAVGHLSGCKVRLHALSTQLSNALKTISVQGKDSQPRYAPTESYPYIRYTRHGVDGWSTPATTEEQAKTLSSTVSGTRAYLKTKFSKML